MRHLPLACVTVVVLARATPLGAQDLPALPWRSIGPASFGGRIDDIEAVPGKPGTIFVGTAGGGVFRTTNNGTTWSPVFDRDGTSTSIGDIAIAPSDPGIVWVGTGEANNRQSSTWGDGIYRSLDGGDSWTHMGLAATQHIGRVVIHPRNPSIVFVAALGHLWGPNADRGVYRTTDAGATWKRVLAGDSVTGAVDVAIDPDGRTVYAALYQRQRRGFGFIGGGPGSGLFRSRDGGDTWERLSVGLPAAVKGRIGIAIAPSQPSTVYAVIESQNGGVFRSDDRGSTWRRQAPLNPRPMYYSQIRVDPAHPDRLWLLGTNLHKSIDGGRTFTTDTTGDRIHVDHHALWIDPNDGNHMMLGNDGGLYFTYDGARNWDFIDNLPIGQFYDVDVDERDPYFVYGGTQDNGTWGVPIRTYNGVGITNADVVNIAYGDGFFTVTDPADPRYIYANSQSGRAYRVHLVTREERGIRPVPPDTTETYRFNWSTPMARSPQDPRTIYYGGNRLFRTRDGGQSWDVISPDLTRNTKWKELPIMGMKRDSTTLSRDDGTSDYGTLTTVAESPRNAGSILTGSDDGVVSLTTDGGRTWTNITSRFKLPGPRWVSRVLWSAHDPRTAFVSFDGHYDDDMAPYLFRTTDGGATWASITSDLPAGHSVKSIAEHPTNPAVVFAGTEFGLYVTVDGGRHWSRAGGTLPRVRVDDIAIHPTRHDLILGTHGRSIIVLDDVGMFDKGAPVAAAGDAVLYPIRPAMQRFITRILPTPGARTFQAPNPPAGAIITYSLPRGGAPHDCRCQRARRADANSGRKPRPAPNRLGPPLRPRSWRHGHGRGMVRGTHRRVGPARPVHCHVGRTREVGVADGGGRGGFAARHRVRRTRGPAHGLTATDGAGEIVQRRCGPAPPARIRVCPARLGAHVEPRSSGFARRGVQDGPPEDRLVRPPVRGWLRRREVRVPGSGRLDAGVVDWSHGRPATGPRATPRAAAHGPRIAQHTRVWRLRGIPATRARGRGYHLVSGRVAVRRAPMPRNTQEKGKRKRPETSDLADCSARRKTPPASSRDFFGNSLGRHERPEAAPFQ